ncbi:MAG: hypothetical protein QFF03_21230 [Pseudomonadota bacterium]|nr:hypothetical protein [Pseudomonadota bacterium]
MRDAIGIMNMHVGNRTFRDTNEVTNITAQNNLAKGFDARVERLLARNRWS